MRGNTNRVVKGAQLFINKDGVYQILILPLLPKTLFPQIIKFVEIDEI